MSQVRFPPHQPENNDSVTDGAGGLVLLGSAVQQIDNSEAQECWWLEFLIESNSFAYRLLCQLEHLCLQQQNLWRLLTQQFRLLHTHRRDPFLRRHGRGERKRFSFFDLIATWGLSFAWTIPNRLSYTQKRQFAFVCFSHILESVLVCSSLMLLVVTVILATKLWKLHSKDVLTEQH